MRLCLINSSTTIVCALGILLSFSVAAHGQTTTYFSINNGKILDPQGKVFVPRGINVGHDEMAAAIAQGNGNPLLSRFPGINYIRLGVDAQNPATANAIYQPSSTFDSFVKAMTAAHVVVEIEDHSCYGNYIFNTTQNCAPFQDQALAVQNAWYTDLAQHFAQNPYVWLGTLNEPGSTDGQYTQSSIAAISAQQKSNYDTIRATGNNTIINMLAGIGGGNAGTVGANGGFVVADYASMHNIVWEIHAYYPDQNQSGDPAIAASKLTGQTAACCGGSGGFGYTAAQTIPSADGLVPVIFGEYGSGSGDPNSSDASAIVAAMAALQQQNSGIGSAAWQWGHGKDWQGNPEQWSLTSDGTGIGPLTTWGNEVAGLIAAVASTSGGKPSPDRTVITTGGGQQIVDAQGHLWAISGGVVLENSAAAGYSANVIALAYVGGQVYQENSANNWWVWNGGGWTATSNPIETSASGTVITGVSGQYLLDAQGNVWQVSGGVVQENGAAAGYSANVVELAYVNGVVWQENSAKLWWQWSGNTWSPTDGTSTNPLP